MRPNAEEPATDPQGTANFLNWVSDLAEWGRELAREQEKKASSKACIS